jgi:hypothetical protein
MKTAKWSEVGALTSAGTVAATIFCCLPFATGIIGASVAAFGARFAPFQPFLIGTSSIEALWHSPANAVSRTLTPALC